MQHDYRDGWYILASWAKCQWIMLICNGVSWQRFKTQHDATIDKQTYPRVFTQETAC